MTTIASNSDIVVGRPLPRDTIRSVDEGVLVSCTDSYCGWQGLFPDVEIGKQAAEAHYAHERRSGEYHFGQRTFTTVLLLDSRTAVTAGDRENLGLSVEENRLVSVDGDVREISYPRTTGDLSDLVETGDLIELPGDRQGKVWRVSETRSLGLPTWTITFVDPDREGWPNPETEWRRGRDEKWLNEMVAVDGTPVMRFTEQEYPVVGRSEEFQAMLGGFDADPGGESA